MFDASPSSSSNQFSVSLAPKRHYTRGGINSKLRGTVWVNPSGKERKEGDPEPTYVVKTMEELPAIVDALLAADGA